MTTLVLDQFDVASDTNLDGRTPAPTGTAWSVLAATATTAVLRVFAATDALGPSASENSCYIVASATPNPTGAEYDVQITVHTPFTGTGSRHWGVAGRYTSASDAGYAANLANGQTSGNDRQLVKRVGGTNTVLAQTDVGDWTAGDVVTLEIRDATKRLLVNGTEVLSSTDNTITAAGVATFFVGNLYGGNHIRSEWRFDDYTVTEAGGPAPIEGAGAATQADQTGGGAGIVGIAGAGAIAQTAQTAAGAGSVAISAAGAQAQAAQTGGGAAAVATAGVGVASQAAQTGTGAGAVAVSGAGAQAQTAHTGEGTGALALAAQAATSQAAQSGSGAGALSLTGQAATGQAADTGAAEGVVGSSPITAAGATTQAAQTGGGAGVAALAAQAAALQDAATGQATGILPVAGQSATGQAGDTADAHAALVVAGAGAAAQAGDAPLAAGTLAIAGAGVATQAAQTGQAAGTTQPAAPLARGRVRLHPHATPPVLIARPAPPVLIAIGG